MYGLSEDFDASVFVDALVESICVSENTVHLELSDSKVIALQGSFAVSEGGLEEQLLVPLGATFLLSLPGRTITAATVVQGRDLRLEFDDGRAVTCLDDSDMYESYSISINGVETIV